MSEIYDTFSDSVREYLDSVFSETLKNHGHFYIVAMMFKDTQDMPDKPEDVPLNSLSEVIKYIDDEDILYGRRYECFNLENNKWYKFFGRLEILFIFLESLLWLHKKDIFDEAVN